MRMSGPETLLALSIQSTQTSSLPPLRLVKQRNCHIWVTLSGMVMPPVCGTYGLSQALGTDLLFTRGGCQHLAKLNRVEHHRFSRHRVRVRHVGLLAPIAALWCRLAFATRHNDDTRDAMAATIGVPNSCPIVVADVVSDA